MAFEGKKIDELKWVIASVFNQSFQISRAIKITGWLGVVLSILSIAYASVLFAFSSFSSSFSSFGVILAIVAGLQAVPGVTFLIFNIFLLTRAGHEDSVTKIIRTGCYILSIFGFPISLLAIIGIVNSNKELIKAYVIFLFVMMILSAFSWLGYVIQDNSWLFSGNIVCNLLWYRYIMNMYVIQINIM